MEKTKLIKLFKLTNILAGIGITFLGIALFVFGLSDLLRYIGIGISIGVWPGILFNHYIQIPKVYGNKDERELVLMIVAIGAGTSFLAVVCMILWMITVVAEVTFSLTQFYIIFATVIVSTLAIRIGGYKFLDTFL